MASGRVPTRQQSRAWCADSQGRAGSTVRRPPAARTTRELLDWELQAQGRQPTWGARAQRLRKAQCLASPIPQASTVASPPPLIPPARPQTASAAAASQLSIEKAGASKVDQVVPAPARSPSQATLSCAAAPSIPTAPAMTPSSQLSFSNLLLLPLSMPTLVILTMHPRATE